MNLVAYSPSELVCWRCMEMKGRLFWLSDAAWDAIEPHLPHGQAGKPRVDDRRVISGILHVLKTGCRWRDVPRNTVRPPRSTTAITGGRDGAYDTAFRADGRRRPHPAGAFHRQHPRKGTPLRSGPKRGRGRKRLASRVVEERARSIAWPIIAGDRSHSR